MSTFITSPIFVCMQRKPTNKIIFRLVGYAITIHELTKNELKSLSGIFVLIEQSLTSNQLSQFDQSNKDKKNYIPLFSFLLATVIPLSCSSSWRVSFSSHAEGPSSGKHDSYSSSFVRSNISVMVSFIFFSLPIIKKKNTKQQHNEHPHQSLNNLRKHILTEWISRISIHFQLQEWLT